MIEKHRWIEPDPASFPFQDEIRDGESGQGYALRMACGNGLSGLLRVKQLLGKTHSVVLDSDDAASLARWFGGSVQLLEFALERQRQGRREQGFHYAGQTLGRSYFLTRSFPRVCPDCVRELGYCRIAWDVALSVACVRHGRVLLDCCPTCRRALSWNRPGIDVCPCGYTWSMGDRPEKPTACELFVAHYIDQRMGDHRSLGTVHGAMEFADDDDARALASLARNLSLDGVMRIVYALATAAMYDRQLAIDKRERSSLRKARQTVAMAAAFGAKAAGLEPLRLRCHRPTVLVDLLSDLVASPRATSDDLSLAQSMLGWLLINSPRSTWASKHVSLSQRELF